MLNKFISYIINSKEKTVKYIAVFSLVISCVFLLIFPVFLYISNQIDNFTITIFRLSIFYLSSIITMSIFIINLSQKMSPNQYLNNAQSYWLMIGVSLSFITLITSPQNKQSYDLIINNKITVLFYNGSYYLYNTIIEFLDTCYKYYLFRVLDYPKLDQSGSLYDLKINVHIESISNYIIFINIIFFFLSSFVFILILYKFFNALTVVPIINKNFKGIVSLSNLKGIQNLEGNKLLNVNLSHEESGLIIKKLEVFYQNISYLIILNNKDITKESITTWNNMLNHVVDLIFHTRNFETSHEALYSEILILQKRLIILLAKDPSYNYETEQCIQAMFKFLPNKNLLLTNDTEDLKRYKLESVDYVYRKNIEELTNIYFLELYNTLTTLYTGDKSDIFNALLNGSLEYASFAPSIKNIEKGIEDAVSLNNKIEDLFILVIFKMIELDKSKDLSIIMGLLLSNQNTVDQEAVRQILNSPKKSRSKERSEKKIKISDRTLRNLVLTITKACEVENYKAAGYIVKILSNYVQWEDIITVIRNIENKINLSDNKFKFKLCDVNTSFNNFSLKYCFKKSAILLALQYSYINNYKIEYKLNDFVDSEMHDKVLDSLLDRKKEYSLHCIDKECLILYKALNFE